ncbi:hypothetical protein BCF55_0263 [Hydrogenivirga caldilitoris]|uniref:Uncharacterized protein n=2 Tax=Hydrogenivirga caldilitoris TaxID=246264 RepID=A0A497XS87_9AQUI|nr:hypothetical protein BCF55_0263 [Hydrogenivirga caldilitoris]
MGAIGPYHYKVWVIGDILDRFEDCKNGARKPKAKIFVKPRREDKLSRNAYFEGIVIYSVDIENIIEKLESPLKEIIAGRYFEGDVRTFMEDYGIKSRAEARRLIIKAVNRFFHEIEKYRKSVKKTA